MAGTESEWDKTVLEQQCSRETMWIGDAPVKKSTAERLLPRFDPVDKPAHYNNGGIEAIEYIKQRLGPLGYFFYCEGNSLKYSHRWRYKDPLKDLGKKQVYSTWMKTEADRLTTVEGRAAWLKQLEELKSFVLSFEEAGKGK